MASTSFDEYPFLFYQLILFPVDVSIIVITYLNLIMLIGASFFGIFDCVFPGWYPSLDPHTPPIRRMLRRRPKNPPQDLRWDHCQKRHNHQWARRRVYTLRLLHFQHQTPDIVPKYHRTKADMPLLLSAFCIDAGVERWCHRQARLLAVTPIAAVIHIYCFCVRR